MKANEVQNPLRVKLIHCGNRNIANPDDNWEKSIFFVPMGLFPMADKLNKSGVDVEIINIDLEDGGIEDILDFDNLDAVGLDSHWANQSLVVLDTAALIKKVKPGVFVFLGGYTASFFASEIVEKYPQVDAVIRGDGEEPIVELTAALKKRRETGAAGGLKDVRNLVWRNDAGQVEVNEFTYTAEAADMEKLEFAKLEYLRDWTNYRDLSKFWTQFEPLNRIPVFFLEVGRGCVYNCSFCGGNAKAQKCIANREGYQVRSVESALATIKEAVKYGYELIFPSFEFEGSDKWYIELFERIKEEKLEISFAYGSWGLPSRKLVDKMSETFQHAIIEVSPESGSPEIRKKNKDRRIYYDNKELEESLDHIAAKPNVKIQLYFGYFLAFETAETVYQTLNYITKLFFKYSSIAEVLYLNLSTDPASLLYLDPKKYDVEISARSFSDYIDALKETYIACMEESQLNMTLFRPADMTEAEAKHLEKKIELYKRIFSVYRRSTAIIMAKTRRDGADGNVIIDYIKEADLTETLMSRFTPDMVKAVLLEICQKNNIQGAELYRTIDKENKETGGETVNYNIAGRVEEIETVTSEEKERIKTTIQKARTTIDADFDLD